jgi:hypothetical protein
MSVPLLYFNYSQVNSLCIIKEEDNFEGRIGMNVEGRFPTMS